MAKFEGIQWAESQMQYLLGDKRVTMLPKDDKTYAVSRSIHYGSFLCFEGIRFFCRRANTGKLELVFMNWKQNLKRVHDGIAFNLGRDQQDLVPGTEELEKLIIERYFSDPSMKPFLREMADQKAQGYLRPFTLDEEQSIGVTFPAQPAIRMLASRYERYLGEPFCGVVIPDMVRAVGVNKTGCLKLGVNYLISVKAVDAAKQIAPEAAAALFLDDQTHMPLDTRIITEWDSSCCLFAFTDGTVIKIPENPLILPSVTIQGIVAILREQKVKIEERHLSYGELKRRALAGELVAACSVGTAGIINRCQKLVLTGENNAVAGIHAPQEGHELYAALGGIKATYWDIYKGLRAPAPGMAQSVYSL